MLQQGNGVERTRTAVKGLAFMWLALIVGLVLGQTVGPAQAQSAPNKPAKPVAQSGRGRSAPLGLDAPPVNDVCGGAEVVPAAGPFPYLTTVTNIFEATATGDPLATCGSSGGVGIWYTFTPSTTNTYQFQTCNPPTATATSDTILTIFTSTGACGGPFTSFACNDDGCGLKSLVSASLTAGTTYYILAYKYSTTLPLVTDTIQVQVSIAPTPTPTPTTPPPPGNETCAGPIALSLNTLVNGSLASSVNDYQLAAGSACFTGVVQTASTAVGRDVVYSFTPSSSGNYSVRTQLSSTSGGGNLVLYMATSCPIGAPPQTVTCTVASNRTTSTVQYSGTEELYCVPLTAGITYYIFVDESTLSAVGGAFTIAVTPCVAETEPNGTTAQANALQCGIEGSISPAADIDFYDLGTPASGSRVFALIDGVAGNSNDFDLRITTSIDTLEYDDAGADIFHGSLAPTIAGRALTGVQSFIRANHFSASTQSEPYRIFSVVQPAGAGLGGSAAVAEAEPNDTVAAANANAGNFFSGSLAATTDIDVFGFSAVAGEVVFLSLDPDPLRDLTPFNPILALLDAAGNVVVQVNDTGTTSSNTTGAGSLTATTPNSPAESIAYRIQTGGAYYARVTWSSGTVPADYLLSISRNCAVGNGGLPTATPSPTFTVTPSPTLTSDLHAVDRRPPTRRCRPRWTSC